MRPHLSRVAYGPARSRYRGFVDVPIVYYSVQWWRSIHPVQVIGPEAADDALEPIMARILIFSFVAMLALFTYLLLERMAVRKSEDRLADLRRAYARDDPN